MKKKLKSLVDNPILIIFIIILVCFMPSKIFAPGENRERGVVTAVGIDKVGDEYEVSFLVFIPSVNQAFDDKESVITGRGKSVGEAVYETQIAMGRKIGLYHTKTTVVNLALMEEDGVNALDYFGRLAGFPENTVFICTDKSAKDVLSATQSLRDDLGFKLEQVVGFNAEHVYVSDTSLESFYRGYYSPSKSSLIGFLTTATKEEEEEFKMQVSPAEEENAGSSGGGEGEDKEKKSIINNGISGIVKNGRIVKLLTLDQINSLNLLKSHSVNQVVKVDDVEIEGERVNAVYKILDKKINISSKFENGIPIFEAHVIMNLSLIELENATSDFKVNTEFIKLTPQISEKLDGIIKRKFADVIKLLKEEGSDVIGVNDQFMRHSRREYMNYIKDREPDEFIKDVVFKLVLNLEAD